MMRRWGEDYHTQRKKQAYTLVPVYDEDMDITPQLQAKIEQARQEYKEGKTLRFESAEEVQKWMDELGFSDETAKVVKK